MPPLSKSASGVITATLGASSRNSLASSPSESIGQEDNGLLRRWLHVVIETTIFETVVGTSIVINLICIVLQADIAAACVNSPDKEPYQCQRAWLEDASVLFQAIYTIEALLRVFVHRCRVFADKWFLFDLFIIVVGYLDMLSQLLQSSSFPGIQMLRIFRVGRLLRGVRLLRKIPELHSMILGFMSAMHAMVWGTLVILLLLMIFAILAVELINPITVEIFSEEDWCREAFSSVLMATLYFFQTLLGGDSWGACAVPIVKSRPWTFLIFSGALVCIQLGFTNLVLAVIVEKAAEINHQLQILDMETIRLERESQRLEARSAIHDLCKQIDADGDGIVTRDELTNAFHERSEVKNALMLLDIEGEDISDLFYLMDADDSGDLTYDEITRCIYKADTQDLKRQIMFLKLQMKKMYVKLDTLCTEKVHPNSSYQGDYPKSLTDELALQAVFNADPCNRHDQSVEQISSIVQDTVQIQIHQLQKSMDDNTSVLLKHIERICCGQDRRCEKETKDAMNSDTYWVQPDASWGVPTDCFEVRSSVENQMATPRRVASKVKAKACPENLLGSALKC